MDAELIDNDLGKWFSTYGFITAERILSKFHISLPQEDLLDAIKSPNSFYHKILSIPIKNVLNGIVLQQANDYHVYVQKLFIDYLLSGESGKDAGSQGASVREQIEEERSKLLILGEEYHQKKVEHDALIASSQLALINITKSWNKEFEAAMKLFSTTLASAGIDVKKSVVRKAINHIMIHGVDKGKVTEAIASELNTSISDDLNDKLLAHLAGLISLSNDFTQNIQEFTQKTEQMAIDSRNFRTQFYDIILRTTALIKLLPDYRINMEQDKINREPLYFDKNIGGI